MYKDYVGSHGCNIYNTAAYTSMAIMYPCNSKYHGITHWKFVLRCCDKCPIIVLPSQEENKDTTKLVQK